MLLLLLDVLLVVEGVLLETLSRGALMLLLLVLSLEVQKGVEELEGPLLKMTPTQGHASRTRSFCPSPRRS